MSSTLGKRSLWSCKDVEAEEEQEKEVEQEEVEHEEVEHEEVGGCESPEAAAVGLPVVGSDGDTLGGEDLVEEEHLGGTDSGEETPEGPAPVELSDEGAGGEAGEEGGHVGQEVEGVAEQHGLEGGDGLYLGAVGEDLGLLADQTGVADCEAVEEVHQDDHDEENKAEEEEVGEGGEVAVEVKGEIAELELADKHGGRLDEAEPGLVEENIFFLFRIRINFFVEENEEAEAEGDDEERVPGEEEEEGLHDPEEHGDVDVVLLELGVPADEDDELGPGEDDGDGGEVPVQLVAGRLGGQKDARQDDDPQLDPVLEAGQVPLHGHRHLEDLPEDEDDQETGQDDSQDALAEDDEDEEDNQKDGLNPV